MSHTQAPTYQTVLLGQVLRFEDLSALYPAEESTPEGALILLQLHLSQPVTPEEMMQLNRDFVSAGVPPWPGNTDVVFLDPTGYAVYFEWQKGQAQLLIAIGLIAAGSILPGLMTLGGLTSFFASGWTDIWNALGEMMTMGGFMMLMMSIMGMLKPLMTPASSKQVQPSAAPVVIEEVQQPKPSGSSWSQAAKEASSTLIKSGAGYVAGKIQSKGSSPPSLRLRVSPLTAGEAGYE